MARKSRKNIEDDLGKAYKQTQLVFDVGAYVRLSADDKKHKGDSIETQQAIINAFIAKHPDLELRETYIDTVSGQTLNRPAFQRMLNDMKIGKINCCITKDLSRFARNSIDAGYYAGLYFPTHKIRFIAINDDYDSMNEDSGGIMINLKNVVNERYALEVGRKIHATKQMNIKNGCFVGRFPPYGYLKNCEDKHRLIPDDYAAAIVLRMFKMAADGKSIKEILTWLTNNKVMPPKRYFHSIGLATEKEASGHIHWNRGVLYSILHNRVYCGDMVQGKGRTRSYTLQRLPKSEWVITENTHEGIVNRELFAEVQKLWDKPTLAAKRQYKTTTSENIFLRKIFCGHCGYTMRRSRTSETQYSFMCDTRHFYDVGDCSSVSINENALKEDLFVMLREKTSVFAGIQKSAALLVKQDEADKTELKNIRAELKNNKSHFKDLYENFLKGNISNAQYMQLKEGCGEEIEELTKREKEIRNSAQEQKIKYEARCKAAANYQSVKNINDITAAAVDKLIEKILVFEDKRIEVYYKFKEAAEDVCSAAEQPSETVVAVNE